MTMMLNFTRTEKKSQYRIIYKLILVALGVINIRLILRVNKNFKCYKINVAKFVIRSM